jgi:hypothetical protein
MWTDVSYLDCPLPSSAGGTMSRLTKAQAAALQKRIDPMLRYLLRCRQRLYKRGFDHRSKFYQAVHAAYDGLHSLSVTLHYESVGQGVGQPPKEE